MTNDSHNPQFPLIAGASKFRRLATQRPLTREESKAYGAAVLAGIRSLQRLELVGRGSTLTHKAPTLKQVFEGSYPLAPVPATHVLSAKGGKMHDPKNWCPRQFSRYQAAMAETRAARETKVEAPVTPRVLDRSAIMRAAHAAAKVARASNPGRTYAAHFSEALKTAWAAAKA